MFGSSHPLCATCAQRGRYAELVGLAQESGGGATPENTSPRKISPLQGKYPLHGKFFVIFPMSFLKFFKFIFFLKFFNFIFFQVFQFHFLKLFNFIFWNFSISFFEIFQFHFLKFFNFIFSNFSIALFEVFQFHFFSTSKKW